ncbi:MAG: hypothetical protein E7167_02005 [Firmicutes bacterium]|nr:hypothetical protein [Bacillota bacterium]
MTNRGINLENINHYLNTTDGDILNPSIIANVREGAKMLISHIHKGDKVLIQIDSDADGFTSSALLINYLNCLFPAFVRNNISYRLHTGKQHGIVLDTIPDDVKLVIAPDSSSNDYEVHEALALRGVDVLVIDHHDAEKVSEYACVINNQLCDYPTKSLSGVGMVYKFCAYLDQLLKDNKAEQFLDLVAVGMVADMMDLRDFETRHLVVSGLNKIRNPYLKGMINTNEYSISRGGGLNPFTVAFYIAPYINATIRVGTQDEKLMLFESMLDYRGYEQIPSTKRGCKGQVETRVEQACRNCTNIKKRQTNARDSSLNIIEQTIKERNLLDHKLLVIQVQDVDTNLTGLIANELASKYQRPTLLLNKKVNEEGVISWEGSGRNYSNSPIESFRELLLETGFAMYSEGHASAFGFGVLDSNFDEFISYTDNLLADFDFSPCYTVDKIYHYGNFNPNDILKVAELKPIWGQGLEEPLIVLEQLDLKNCKIDLMSRDKNPTLKITLPQGLSLIKFGSSEEEYDNIINSDFNCVNMNIVGKCDKNEWGGRITPQISIEDYEIVAKKYIF